MKAQSLIFEQVMLFAVGIILFIICLAIFTIYQNHYRSVGLDDKLDELKEWIASNIIKVAENGENVNITISLKIPRTIENEAYIIRLDSNGLNITTRKKSKFSSLYNLNKSFELGGKRIISTEGGFIIYKKENKIILT